MSKKHRNGEKEVPGNGKRNLLKYSRSAECEHCDGIKNVQYVTTIRKFLCQKCLKIEMEKK